jgi:branched-chain amino acid transport system substrate-binding protein
MRAAKPDAVFFFLPGGMGINFVKQYVAAGADKEAKLYTPGFSADEDTIKAVGDPMIGILNTSQWAADLDNPANKKFVQEFQKEYGRPPTMYASQAYDVALLVDAAVKQIGGKVEDKEALRKALVDAKFDATRGKFRFNKNHFPIQDYYLREVYKDANGRITNKTVSKVFSDFQDVHAAKCKMN